MKRFAPLSSLAMVFSLFLVFAIWLTPASANTPPVFSSLGQLRATGMGAPAAMDLDAAGNLYVADAMGRKIYRFDPYGNLKRVYDVQASGRGLAVTPDGTRLYVARHVVRETGTLKEQIGSAVIVDTATGAVLGELTGSGDAPEFKLTGEIDLDADGNVFVADAGSGRLKVKVYSANGQFLSQFGGVGSGPGKFQSISAMAINGAGQVVVADPSPAVPTSASTPKGMIHVFTLDPANFAVTSVVGYLKNTAANFGSVELHSPRGIVFDNLGRGYFLEYMFSTITVLNNSFGYLSKFNNTGYTPGQLAYVADVVFQKTDPQPGQALRAAGQGRLFVSCDGGRIEILSVDYGSNPVHANEPPAVPEPQTPVGGSVETTDAPVLAYAAAKDDNDATLTYQVVVKRGDETVYTTSTTATSVTVPSGLLAENGSFAWAVQAVDSEGEVSGFSSAAAFVVNAVEEAPTAPELLAPLAGATLGSDGQFSWTSSSDPDPGDGVAGYLVEVANEQGELVVSADLQATTMQLGDFGDYANLEVGTAYLCRVIARDVDGDSSASETVRFVYDTTVLKVDAALRGSVVSLSGNLAYPGRPVGTTPLELRDLAPGYYMVMVEAAGFEPNLTQITVSELGKSSVYAALKPALQPQAFKEAKAINDRPGLQVNAAAAPFVIDLDGNARLDLLVGDALGGVSLFPNIQFSARNDLVVDTAIPFSLPEVIPGAVPFIADWNNDDHQDLLVGAADGTVKLLLNDGQGQFGAPQNLPANNVPLTVGSGAAPVVVDLDSDGRKDLVVGNTLGRVFVFWNQEGTDAAPQLAAPVLLFEQAGGPVVPSSVDWNADGLRDLLVASAGGITVYLNDLSASGTFVATPLLAIPAKAVAPVDADGRKGKDLIVGAADGRLLFFAASAASYPASYPAALLEKTAELETLLIEAQVASGLLDVLAVIRGQIADASYPGVAVKAQQLAAQLPAGPAQQAALELLSLCEINPIVGDEVAPVEPKQPVPVKRK